MTGRRWIVLGMLSLVGTPAFAQAVVQGTVLDSATGLPLGRAAVNVLDAHRAVVADSNGWFRLEHVPPGSHLLYIGRVGYAPVRSLLTLGEHDTVSVLVVLTRAPTTLPEISVTAPRIAPKMVGFEQRRHFGFGRFLSPAVLRANEHRTLANLIRSRVPGVVFAYHGGQMIPINLRGGCPMAVWLDGMRLTSIAGAVAGFDPASLNPGLDFNRWSPQELEGVEVYTSLGETPMRFSGLGAACGTIALWSRVR